MVSAMIHAATLVIAGVVWCAKCVVLFWCPFCIMVVFSAGTITYSLVSMCCIDVKRLVAYSTGWHVSILSIMMLIGVHWCICHIVVHALFKSVLFLVIGSIIHAVGCQDCRTASCTSWHITRSVLCLWCVYCSIGWCYSAVFLTKKVLVDSL